MWWWPIAPKTPAGARFRMRVVTLVMVALAAVAALSGMHAHARVTPVHGDVRTDALVVDVVDDCGGACAYQPVLAFTTPGGDQVVVDGAARPLPPVIGSSEAIAYDPAHPADIRDVGAGDQGWVTDLTVAGLLVLLAAVTWAATPAIARAVGRRQRPDRVRTPRLVIR